MSEKRDFRAFVVEISKDLSQQEADELVYIEGLPVACLGKSPLSVLWQLQMNGVFSCTDTNGLMRVLKRINRLDLVAKLKKYNAKKSSKRKKRTEDSYADCFTLHVTLEARLEALFINGISMRDQLAGFAADAQKAGKKRVGEVVASFNTDSVLDVLSEAKRLLKHENSPSPSPSEEEEAGSSLSRQSSEGSSSGGEGVQQPASTSTPRSRPPCPSPKPAGSKRTSYPPPVAGVRSMAELYPPPVTAERHVITQGQLVTGKAKLAIPGTQKKAPLMPPTLKSKVTEKPAPQTVVEDGYVSSSTGGDCTGGGDYTDDSGFVDASRYLRRPPEPVKPPKEPKPAYYKTLEVPKMDKVDYYTTFHHGNQPPAAAAEEFDDIYEPLTRETGMAYCDIAEQKEAAIYQNQ